MNNTSNVICNECMWKMDRGEIPHEESAKIMWYGSSKTYKCKICGHVGTGKDFNDDF